MSLESTTANAATKSPEQLTCRWRRLTKCAVSGKLALGIFARCVKERELPKNFGGKNEEIYLS
jgi:hypothetical protein